MFFMNHTFYNQKIIYCNLDYPVLGKWDFMSADLIEESCVRSMSWTIATFKLLESMQNFLNFHELLLKH